jgi:hypothetical protein
MEQNEDNQIDEETNGADGEIEIEQNQCVEFMPSDRLALVERSLPKNKKAFVGDGMAKKTLCNTFKESMKSRAATNGLENLEREWLTMIAGPEAERLVDTFGGNFKKFVTSPNGAEMANTVTSTLHSLLARAGAETRHSGLGEVISMIISLFRSPEMPEIVNLTGGLIISAVNKENGLAVIHQFWVEVQKLLDVKNVNRKVQTAFDNLLTTMNELAKKQPRNKSAPV